MPNAEITLASERTLSILNELLNEGTPEIQFPDLVNRVIGESNLDEATVKASVLRLNSEGRVEVTPEWTVRLSHTARAA